jgi:hypothetical protein
MRKTRKPIIAAIATLAFGAPVLAAAAVSATPAAPRIRYHTAPTTKYHDAKTVLADGVVPDTHYHS